MMVSTSSAMLLVCTLLAAPPESAPLPVLAPLPGVRRIELETWRAGAAREVAVSPGLTTTFLFNSELSGEEVEHRKRFRVVDPARYTLTLVPSTELAPGTRVGLTVSFADGLLPASADFVLAVHATKAERQVEVYRSPRNLESVAAEAVLERMGAQLCREENARLLVAPSYPEGLIGLMATGRMDVQGVFAHNLTETFFEPPKNALDVKLADALRSSQRVAVRMLLSNGSQVRWQVQDATLVAADGSELPGLQVWPREPIPPGEEQVFMVEADAPRPLPPGPFTLRLVEEDGLRTVTVGNITFP